jgi:hypothetical protein
MRAQEFITDALVHRAHVGSSDPNDIWHVRDDTTRKLRSRRNQVVLANAQPVVMSADAMRSRTYNIGPNTGKRYQLLGGYHMPTYKVISNLSFPTMLTKVVNCGLKMVDSSMLTHRNRLPVLTMCILLLIELSLPTTLNKATS